MAVKSKPNSKSTRKRSVKKNEEGMNQAMLNFVRNSQLLSRSMLGSRLGVQFDGQRDLYESFGYKRFPDFQDYWNIYKRHGLGHRVINKFADSTWNKTPVLIDGEQRSDTLDKGATPFLKEWVALAKRLGVTQVMRQADIMSQIGQFSILFLGASGNDYSQPAKKTDGLFFLSAYSEANVTIQQLIQDAKNEKFGMPETYVIQFNELDVGLVMPGGTNVHHTRVIHIAEDRLGSRIYGTPRLEAPLNRLWDLEKTTGGGAEAAWLATWGGMLLTVGEDMSIPEENSEEAKQMDEQMQKFFHRLQRYAVVKGVEVNNLGVQNVDIDKIYNTLKTDLAGTVGIPQRILFGSERGELASSQDMQEWNSLVETRRTNHAEPEVLYPFIDWCIAMGVLPAPKSGEYKAEWYPPYTMTQIEKAAYGESLARGANSITGGVPETAMDVNEWRIASGLSAREDAGMVEETPLERKQRDYQERLKITSDTNIGNLSNDNSGSNGNNKNKFPALIQKNGRKK